MPISNQVLFLFTASLILTFIISSSYAFPISQHTRWKAKKRSPPKNLVPLFAPYQNKLHVPRQLLFTGIDVSRRGSRGQLAMGGGAPRGVGEHRFKKSRQRLVQIGKESRRAAGIKRGPGDANIRNWGSIMPILGKNK